MSDDSFELKFQSTERTMKDALASFHQLTMEQAKALGIGEECFWDVKNRLIRQGIKINFADRLGNVLKISRPSQLKLIKQGFGLCDTRE